LAAALVSLSLLLPKPNQIEVNRQAPRKTPPLLIISNVVGPKLTKLTQNQFQKKKKKVPGYQVITLAPSLEHHRYRFLVQRVCKMGLQLLYW